MENYYPEFLSNWGMHQSTLLPLLFSAMVGILFTQSGLDKVLNWKGELRFYQDHFKNSLLGGTEPFLLPVITIFELAAGTLSIAGLFSLVFSGNRTLGFWGMLLATLSLIQLFLGQRIAKDYAGAASLVPYFLLAAGGLYFYIN